MPVFTRPTPVAGTVKQAFYEGDDIRFGKSCATKFASVWPIQLLQAAFQMDEGRSEARLCTTHPA
ncbi:hypothetical protein BAR24_06115 [Gluconobacter oxydans]|nr:hypothetical protein BAR24_06115 [Gluconobacter oxydans]